MTSDIISTKSTLRIGAFLVGITDEQVAIHLDQNTVADDGDRLPRPLIVRNRCFRDFLKIIQAAGFLRVGAGVAELHLLPFRHNGLERRDQDDATAAYSPCAGIERHPAAQVLAVEQHKPTVGARHSRHWLAENSLRSPRAAVDCQQKKQDQTISPERHFVAPNSQRL